jgi:hypothetical protein
MPLAKQLLIPFNEIHPANDASVRGIAPVGVAV